MGAMTQPRQFPPQMPRSLCLSRRGRTAACFMPGFTPWPEVRFERRFRRRMVPTSPAEDALASAAQALGPLDWRPYLEFVPAGARVSLAQFAYARMEALQVIARCPALLPELAETPGVDRLVVAAHT